MFFPSRCSRGRPRLSPAALWPGRAAGRGHSLIPSFAPHPRTLAGGTHQVSAQAGPAAQGEAEARAEGEAGTEGEGAEAPAAPPASAEDDDALALRAQRAAEGPRRQGCSAAHRHETGVVVLDFGKPAFYARRLRDDPLLGPLRAEPQDHERDARLRARLRPLPAGRLAPRRSSSRAARATTTRRCRAPTRPACAGRARRTGSSASSRRHGLAPTSRLPPPTTPSPPGIRSFRQTRQFFHGFRAAVHGHTLYDYGSLDGGVGAIWSARQAWYVAGGLRNTKALPEIYNSAMAREWAELARIAHGRYHRDVHFAGVMTQALRAATAGSGRGGAPGARARARRARASATFRCRTAARTSSVRGGSESAPVSAGADLTRSGSGARARRRSSRCRRRPPRPGRRAASARSRAARRGRRAR